MFVKWKKKLANQIRKDSPVLTDNNIVAAFTRTLLKQILTELYCNLKRVKAVRYILRLYITSLSCKYQIFHLFGRYFNINNKTNLQAVHAHMYHQLEGINNKNMKGSSD